MLRLKKNKKRMVTKAIAHGRAADLADVSIAVDAHDAIAPTVFTNN